jgi:hypothetical protein
MHDQLAACRLRTFIDGEEALRALDRAESLDDAAAPVAQRLATDEMLGVVLGYCTAIALR